MKVAEVWRYPVKSFQGERVERLEIGQGGAAGDRLLAVVDFSENAEVVAREGLGDDAVADDAG